jgi:hypothetical protein
MKLRSMLLAGVAALGPAGYAAAADNDLPVKAPPAPPPAPWFFVNDTTVGAYYAPLATDPGVSKTAKFVLELTHFDAWALGTNFINIDYLQSDRRDPAFCDGFGPPQASCLGTVGALEVYSLYRGTLGFNQLSKSTAFTFGPFKNIDFSFGGDWNTENNPFAPEKKDVVGGLKFEFNVPDGFFNVAVHAYHEWNHNALPGTIVSNVEFHTVPELEFTYMKPLEFTGLPLRIAGFTNVVFPKGRDGFGNQTVTEVLTDERLILDIGKLAANKPNWWDVYIGYRYWRNKFGNDDSVLPFAKEETYYFGFAWHALTDTPPSKPANLPVKAPAPAWKPFFLVSDTTIGVYDAPRATDPGVNVTNKVVLEITHFDAWALGTNFFNVDFLWSDPRDPAQCDGFGTQPSCLGTQGSMEVYSLYRGALGFNQLSKSTAFTFGPFKNIDFSFGADWNTQNNAFAPEKKDLVGGLKFEFNVPDGFFNVAVHAYHEWNHNALPGTIVSNVEFNTVPEFEVTYMKPLDFTGLPLRFAGFTNVVTPKGKDGFGNQTVTELLTDNRLVLDVGKAINWKANLLDAYVGYRYWRNKFGNDDTILAFAKEETYYVGFQWHAF